MNPNGPPKDKRPPLPKSTGRKPGSKNKITRERVERELRFIAFSDPILLFDRVAKGRRVFQLREIAEMPESVRRCIAGIKVRTENLTSGDGQQDTTVEVKLWDKTKALEMCGRTLGLFKDKLEITTSEELLSKLDRAKIRARTESS